MRYIIKNATLVNEGTTTLASVVISGDRITEIIPGRDAIDRVSTGTIVDATGLYLFPGIINSGIGICWIFKLYDT